MITFKRVAVKRETRTLKYTDFSWEYKLDYVARYDGDRLSSISKYETKFFGGPAQISGGEYRRPILWDSNIWKKAKLLIETQGVDA
tara:strand:- start:2 stop:259 length:258 start_codon:yes stop_codon:yes gene_type:complete